MYGWLELDPTHGKRAYAAAECGLCACYGERFRTRTRLLAAADPTLLVLTLEGLADEDAPTTRVRCPLTLKLTKRRALSPTWEPLVAVAELQLVLAGEKLYDDRLDRDGWLTRLASTLLASDIEAASQSLRARGFPLETLRSTLRRQAELESDPRSSLEGLAAPTAEGLGLIAGWLATLVGRPEHEGAMRRFGATLGRLLYVVDALHDLERDRARSRFNPLDHSLGHLAPRTLAALSDRIDRLVHQHRESFAALPLTRHVATLEASLVEGLASRAHEGLTRVSTTSRPLLAT
jgi:hypothetical protein